MNGTQETHCALCGQPGTLRESHIIPAFVFKWLKETSITGFLRTTKNPKRRVQDGLKLRLLCDHCEGRLNAWETAFAGTIFHPYNADNALRVRYDGWLLKFCASVSWRVLKAVEGKTGFATWSSAQKSQAGVAREAWRRVMLGEVPHPGPYEQHLLPLSAMARSTMPDAPDNMNRYLMRAVDMDVVHGQELVFTYAKLGRFALFGLIESPQSRWKGTRVGVAGGTIEPTEYELPVELWDYLVDRARHVADRGAEVPEHQLAKIDALVMNNLERARQSDQLAAMLEDARMFGEQAVVRKQRSRGT